MLLSLCDDCPYMTICKRVEHRFSFSSALYQLILLQNAKLMRNSGLCHIQSLGKIAHAYLCLKKHKQNADSCGIAKYLKKLCKIIELIFLRKSFVYDLKKVFVNLTAIAGFNLFLCIFFHNQAPHFIDIQITIQRNIKQINMLIP